MAASFFLFLHADATSVVSFVQPPVDPENLRGELGSSPGMRPAPGVRTYGDSLADREDGSVPVLVPEPLVPASPATKRNFATTRTWMADVLIADSLNPRWLGIYGFSHLTAGQDKRKRCIRRGPGSLVAFLLRALFIISPPATVQMPLDRHPSPHFSSQ